MSYEAAKAGVTASLANPLVNKGEAGGDFYFSVENLTGSSFADKLVGDARANVLDGGPGGDRLEGGLGSDTASYARATAGVTADLTKSANNTGEAAGDTYLSIENLTGSKFADRLVGDQNDNVLSGSDGADTLIANTGNDKLIGGLGPDMLNGGAGRDVYACSRPKKAAILSRASWSRTIRCRSPLLASRASLPDRSWSRASPLFPAPRRFADHGGNIPLRYQHSRPVFRR